MKHLRPAHVVVAAIAAALLLPASASAHTQVWQSSALVNCTVNGVVPTAPFTHTADQVKCAERQIYVLRLDGTTVAIRETNGRLRDGTFDYQRLPSQIRRSVGFDPFVSHDPTHPSFKHVYPATAQLPLTPAIGLNHTLLWPAPTGPYKDVITGAQPHATCKTPQLDNPAAIRAWQPTHGGSLDPLFAYVPFQRQSAGLNWNPDEDPAKWIPVVLQHAGVNLNNVPDTEIGRRNACETVVGGTYYPADEVQITIPAMSLVTVAQAVAPLQTQISGLQSQLATRDATITSLTQKVAALESSPPAPAPAPTTGSGSPGPALAAAQAEIASLKLALEPLKVLLPPQTPRVSSLASDGISVGLTGPASRTVRTRLRLSAADAKRLDTTRILATENVTFDAAGKAQATLKPSSAKAARLRTTTRNLLISVEASGGDRFTVATATARR